MGTTVGETVTPGHATTATRPGVWLTDLSLVLMTLIWGVNFSVVKYGTRLVDPLAYNGVRVSLAAVTLVLVVFLTGGTWPARRTALVLFGLGVLGNGIYQIFFVEGISRRDYTLTQALVLLVACVFLLVNFAVDIAYAWLDPRIRYR